MPLSIAAGKDIYIEEADVENAYLYGKLDITIVMAQQINCSRIITMPGLVFLLLVSLYSTGKTGCIFRSVIPNGLLKYRFKMSVLNNHLYFFRRVQSFIVLVIVVDQIKFSTNKKRSPYSRNVDNRRNIWCQALCTYIFASVGISFDL